MDFRLERGDTIGSIYDAEHHGNINFTVGPRGLGKTHDEVCSSYKLFQKYDIEELFTNIMFKGNTDNVGIYFGSSIRDMWKNIAKLRMKDPYKKIKVSIDEFQETVHRFRSTSAESVIFDRWFRQLRKQSVTANMITQNTYSSIPINLLYQGDHIFIKSNDLLDEFNNTLEFKQLAELNSLYKDPDRFPEKWEKWLHPRKLQALEDDPRFGLRFWRPPQDPKNKKEYNKWDYSERGKALSFYVDISNDIFKQVYPDGMMQWKDIKQFKEYKITLSDVQGVLETTTTPWTDMDEPGPTYNTNAYASFNIFPLNGESPTKWVPQFMREVGGVDQENLPQVVLDFFEKHEREDISLTPFEDLSDSRKAIIIYEVSQRTKRDSITKKDAAAIFGVTSSAVRHADAKWDEYIKEKHIEKFLDNGKFTDGYESQKKNREGVKGVAPA